MALAHDTVNRSRTDDIKINEDADFASLLLSARTLSGLQKSGFRKPSPIQQQAIPIGKCGFDLVIKSKSGTGKTAVFAVIALEMIDVTQNCIQCLIVAPTREIAVQIQGVIETIGLEYKGLKVHAFIGGMPLAEDTINLQYCHIAVGAPGRLKHLIETGALKTDSVKLLVLDEADKLMESSFYDDINVIYYRLPKCFQMIASSATYPNNLDYYISKYMHTPTHINTLNAETPLLLGLRQFIITIRQTANSMLEKTRLLLKLLSSVQFTQCIVFSNYQTRVESVSNILNGKGFDSVFISAAQAQPDRLAALAKLKSFQCRIILSTDLTARGIDASNVDLVVNYDVPIDVCTYLHRMGRAGRYGSRGLCVTLAENGRELDIFKKIIGFLGGTNMSIAKLLNTADWQSDELWKGDLLNFEQICGVVTSISSYEDVQKSLLELKQYTINDDINKSDSLATNIPTETAHLDNTANADIVRKYSADELSKFCFNPDIQHTKGAFSKLCNVLEPLIQSSNLNEDNVTKILRKNCKIRIKNKDVTNIKDNTANADIVRKYSADEISKFCFNPNIQHTKGAFSKLCNVLEPLIQSSNLNEDNVTKILRKNCKIRIKNKDVTNVKENAIIQLTDDSQESSNDSSSKRKRIAYDDSPSNGFMPQEKKNLGVENIFQKNIGVLNVTRLLCDESAEVSEDISGNIGQFLNQLKGIATENITGDTKQSEELFEKTDETTQMTEDSSDLLESVHYKNLSEQHQRFTEEARENTSDDTEKLFQFAFNYAIDEKEPHWLEGINEDFDEEEFDASKEVDVKENLLEDFQNVDFDAMECDYGDEEEDEELYEDYQSGDVEQEAQENDEELNSKYIDDRIEKEPILYEKAKIKNTKEASTSQSHTVANTRRRKSGRINRRQIHEEVNTKGDFICNSKFNRFFMECGSDFLEKYENHEEFVQFKEFWRNWKDNVHSIREFVQQKIYVEEMLLNKRINNTIDSDDSD